MSTYTEDHLVEQPAIQLMQHELGWNVVNCYDEWSGGVSNQGREGKREVGRNIEQRTPNIEHRSEEKRKIRLNPDLPVVAIEGAVEERGILNVGSVVAFGFAGTSFWILNGRGRRKKGPCRRDFLISLKVTFSPFAETVEFTEIERLQDFTESTNFTAC